MKVVLDAVQPESSSLVYMRVAKRVLHYVTCDTPLPRACHARAPESRRGASQSVAICGGPGPWIPAREERVSPGRGGAPPPPAA